MLLLCFRIIIRLDFLNQSPIYSKTQARFPSFGKRLLRQFALQRGRRALMFGDKNHQYDSVCPQSHLSRAQRILS